MKTPCQNRLHEFPSRRPCPGGSPSAVAGLPPSADWYPKDISPPAGTQYPCALKPLPRALPGVPEWDRLYINHSYSLILKLTQAKLVLLRALQKDRPGLLTASRRYFETSASVETKLAAESVPKGLETFHSQLNAAILLHRAFFEKATSSVEQGGAFGEIFRLPEGRQASSALIAAYQQMVGRYPAWTAAMQDSIFHHLCALDLF